MIQMPGNVEEETIELEDGGKQVISYLDPDGNYSEKYSYNAVNMLIQTYDFKCVLVNEELKENPNRGKYEESEHYEKWLKLVKKVNEEDEKTGLHTL